MLGTVTEVLDNPVEGWVTLKEAGEIVNRDISTIRYWVSKGKLTCYRVGTSSIRIVNVKEVTEYSRQANRFDVPKRGKKKKESE